MLGIIPTWQFSGDPAVNPHINPFMTFPPGMTQSTVQPVGLAGPSVRLLGPSPVRLMGPRPVQLLGLKGFGTISDTVSSIGTFIILGLAAWGGWNVYKRIKK